MYSGAGLLVLATGWRVVGVTEYCNYPPKAESIEKVVDERGQTGSLAQKIKIWLLQISKGNQIYHF